MPRSLDDFDPDNFPHRKRGGTPPAASSSSDRVVRVVDVQHTAPKKAAGLTRLVALSPWLLLVFVLAVTGNLGQVATAVAHNLFGLLMLPLLFIVMISLLRGFMTGSKVNMLGPIFSFSQTMATGLATRGAPNHGLMTTSCDVVNEDGEPREVVVAANRVIALNSKIRVWGPKWTGQQHAWIVRNYTYQQFFLCRGFLTMVFSVLVGGFLLFGFIAELVVSA